MKSAYTHTCRRLTSAQLNSLVKSGIVEDYPPLVDKKGSYTAQFEHVGIPLDRTEQLANY